tara:strand:+ start:329 stop:601 length:273 start_codon:yes stop_codon:yes gene_type:complete
MTSNTTANQIKITIKNLLGNDPRYLGIICAMEDEAESEGIGLDELNNLEIVGMGATEEEAEVLMEILSELPESQCETAAHLDAELKRIAK